jgi:hypothetical protein
VTEFIIATTIYGLQHCAVPRCIVTSRHNFNSERHFLQSEKTGHKAQAIFIMNLSGGDFTVLFKAVILFSDSFFRVIIIMM